MRLLFLSLLSLFFLSVFSPSSSEAALAYRSKTFTSGTSGSGVTPAEPTGAAQNDILFMFLIVNHNIPITAPTGWTTLISFLSTNGIGVRLYWIRRGASAPSYAVSWSPNTTDYYEVSVTAWSGAVTSGNPYDVYAENAPTQRNPSNPDCPSVTTTVANTIVIAFGFSWAGFTATATPPTGYTLVEGAANYDLGVAYIAKASAGAENPSAFTTVYNNNNDVGEITVALSPATSTTKVIHRVISD